jgi:hypothetical protein
LAELDNITLALLGSNPLGNSLIGTTGIAQNDLDPIFLVFDLDTVDLVALGLVDVSLVDLDFGVIFFIR